MSARTSFAALIVGLAAALLTLLVSLAVATGAARSAPSAVGSVERAAVHPNTAIREQKASIVEQAAVHPNTAIREQKAPSSATGSASSDGAYVLHQSSDWAAYRSAERTTAR
jgi:hypothetical protein